MSSVDRQNKLIVAEDWKRIYQSFKNADFRSYDFDNLRRTMIAYLRENYPEDFNDYIESSEYLALIDLIAFLGQNLAFRFDLNARDNFLELAERRESVLRLARLLSYNAKRNQCANGLLKFSSISTTETVLDSNSRNLANQTIVWNDSTNPNWYEQFIKVINSALPETSQFGKPQDKATISGVPTEQYRFNGTSTEVPVYTFTKNIDGRNMNFEVVSSGFKNSESIYEEAPFPGNNLAFLYRDDGSGSASSNTGFFAHFRQGSLQESSFRVSRPSTNQTVDIDTSNVNNSDVWLYELDSVGLESVLWDQVAAVEGNNVIYNSVSKKIRKIYSILTRSNDRVRFIFADGVFGDLPQGNFKAYYRTSNGLSYSINPTDIRNVTISIPYISKIGKQEALTIALSLRYTVNNASAAETSTEIKNNAPATYYTQGRMITGEDYNVLPLSVSQEIVKIKSVNRVSSGVSRFFDLKDTSGKYSTTNLFGTDGILYKEKIADLLSFSASSKSDIENAVINKIQPILSSRAIRNFYLDSYPPVNLTDSFLGFFQRTSATNYSTGYIGNLGDTIPRAIGSFTDTALRYLIPGAIIRCVPPSGKRFGPAGMLVDVANATPEDKTYNWTNIINVVGNGTANSTGVLDSGEGPVKLNDIIPGGTVIDYVIPKFDTKVSSDILTKMVDLIFSRKNFGLRYDAVSTSWRIITEPNIDKNSPFSLGKAGDTTNQQLDSSWIILAETNGETYTITSRGTRYVFESEQEVRFFYDATDKIYDTVQGRIIRDKISVLGINTLPKSAGVWTSGPSAPLASVGNNGDYYFNTTTNMVSRKIAGVWVAKPEGQSFNELGRNLDWEISDEYKGVDGYVDTKKVSISFFDSDEDGIVDDPKLFDFIIDPLIQPTEKFVFQQRRQSIDGAFDFYFVPNADELIQVYLTQSDISVDDLSDGQLVYIIDEDVVKQFNILTSSFVVNSDYRGYVGRSNLKFQYLHSANSSARIDPAATNIIDIFMLTKNYDISYRQWLRGDNVTKPLPPSSDALYINFDNGLSKIKSISDEIIYHPVKYKNLFGSSADSSLQATFKVTKSVSVVVSDNDIKSSVISAINEFFAIENWDFADTFYFGELATFVMRKTSPNISNIVIVPKQEGLMFGSLYEIKCSSDEIFVSSATVDDVEIISEITASRIKAAGTITPSGVASNGSITSA